MKSMFAVACACTLFAAGGLSAGSNDLASAGARSVPDYLRSAVVYQMVLRNFTRAGNFKAAIEMLDHVRSTLIPDFSWRLKSVGLPAETAR